MKEFSYLFSILGATVIVFIIWSVWDVMTKHNSHESELHARDRYAVAEKIDKEIRERREDIKSNRLVKKQMQKRQLVF